MTGNYSLQDEAILLQLNQFVQSYGTHYVAASQAGGVVTQACQMSTFGYTYAEQNGKTATANGDTREGQGVAAVRPMVPTEWSRQS